MTTALSQEALLAPLRGGRPRAEWALGLEHELLPVRHDGAPAPFDGKDGIEALLGAIADEIGCIRREERGRLVGLDCFDGATVTLEPGCQVEFSTPPLGDVTALEASLRSYLQLLHRQGQALGIRFLGIGVHPFATPDDCHLVPKSRYGILAPALDAAGSDGLWMMRTTTGFQVNIDYADEADGMARLRLAFALAPVFAALYAHSPFRGGRPSGVLSARGLIWERTDASRCGIPDFPFREGARLADYVAWALSVPMLFVERDGELCDLRGRSFGQFLEEGADGLTATLADWELHISTVFPEARFRPQLELRAPDGGCTGSTLAFAAWMRGLFYDDDAFVAASELVANETAQTCRAALASAHRDGMGGRYGARSLQDLARELLRFASEGLRRLATQGGPDERPYLRQIEGWAETGQTPAEELLEHWHSAWAERMEPLLDHVTCA